MRDLILTAFILGSVPFILRSPFVGLLMWVWVGIMNPHRLTWGFAYDLPFAQIVAISTLVSLIFNQKKLYTVPRDWTVVFLVLFTLWIGVSPWFSFHPDQEFDLWQKPFKIFFMSLLGLVIVGNREQLIKLAFVLTISVGFFGIKGGIFTLAHGGNYRVWGPEGSFFFDNNALALAVIMTVPLFRYFQLLYAHHWARYLFLLSIMLCVVSALGSHSRGALLAIASMSLFLVMKSRGKILMIFLILLAVLVTPMVMPEAWFDRMSTITEYKQDASSMGRINAWWMAWNLAVDRFPIGGGFAVYDWDVFLRYAPDPLDLHAAHSIYFQVLGEHGFVGLALFMLIFGLTWFNASGVIRRAGDRVDLVWAKDLALMTQVSLVGFAVGGAFLSLAYFDYPYYLVIIMVILRRLVDDQVSASKELGNRKIA